MALNITQAIDSNDIKFEDGFNSALPEVARMGRGATDTDITYITLRNATGVLTYCYPNSGGTGLTVTTTRP